jgi:23S rRNA (uracil1939-C5)-methyltransferase
MNAIPEVRVELQRLELSGQARGRAQGKLVFVWGGLPQESVTARVTRRSRHSLSCVATEIHTPSVHRVAPCEDHYLTCSPWQILAEEQEPHYKAALVAELFSREFQLQLPDFPVATSASYGYRNKMEFSFTDTPEGLSLAFFERESHRRKIPLAGCLLGAPAINEAARHVRDVLRGAGVSAEPLKSLVLRSNQRGQVAAALYVREAIRPICDQVCALPNITGMRVFFSNPRSPAAVADELLEGTGTEILVEEVFGKTFHYSDRSFFQVNIPLYERVLTDMRAFLDEPTCVYDMYAGVGTIGICAGAPRTVFVESDPDCLGFLRENCERNGAGDVEVLAAPAEKIVDCIPAPATVILDPPRAGIHPRVLTRLLNSRPRRVIYLSCNPQTQAHDLRILGEVYQLVHFSGYNFFPRTPRIETLAVLDRRVS